MRRSRRRPARLRDAQMAGGRRHPRAHRSAHGRGAAGRQRVHRPRRASRGASRGIGARRPGGDIGEHQGPGRGEPPGRSQAQGPWSAPAQRPRPLRTPVPARRRRAGRHVPRPAHPGLDAEQSAHTADELRRARGRCGRGHAPAGGHAIADAHRPRRHRQDAAQPAGGRGRGADVSRRRLLRATVRRDRPGPDSFGDRAVYWPFCFRQPTADRRADRAPA